MRARIGRYACENGVAAAARRMSRELDKPLNESTVRRMKRLYQSEVQRKKRAREEDDTTVEKLEPAKRGRPLLLGKRIDEKVKGYVYTLRESGAVVNSAVVIASAKGIIRKLDRTLLSDNGGHVDLTRGWAKSFLSRMGFVKRRVTTKSSRMTVENFNEIKEQFLADIRAVVELESVSPELIFNWDQTGG